MYKIEFYTTQSGYSELLEFLEELERKAPTDKNARIQNKKILQYIQLLADNGTKIGTNITKHVEDNIWELRPDKHRVLFFYYKNNTYVLLHSFRKKTQKTPRRELEKAKAERDDWLSRKED